MRTVLRTCMIADYLRPYAQWRIDRPGPRNARAAIGLIDAAAYVAHLDRIREKTGRRRRPDLTRLAIEEGIAHEAPTTPSPRP